MATLQVQAYLMLLVAVFCAVRTYRDFAKGQTGWGIISLVATIAMGIAVTMPMPTHAVKIDLPR